MWGARVRVLSPWPPWQQRGGSSAQPSAASMALAVWSPIEGTQWL
jgi:hypothetical protein